MCCVLCCVFQLHVELYVALQLITQTKGVIQTLLPAATVLDVSNENRP